MILVDASVWIDYLRGASTEQVVWLDANLGSRRLGLADLTLCEVLQGILDERTAAAVRKDLLAFEIFPTGGIELALAAEGNYRKLRRLGVTVRKTLDCWLATFCLREGHTLLHNDRDFEPFAEHLGLHVVRV
jgi:predicted nucleic acid-binding protein